MKIGEIFADLLTKVGKNPQDEIYKSILSIQDEIDEDTTLALQQGLMTEEAAKSKKSIKEHHNGNLTKGMDQALFELLSSYGMEDLSEEVSKISGTGKRHAFVLSKMKERIDTAAGSGGDTKLSEITKKHNEQLQALNTQLDNIKRESAEKLSSTISAYDKKIVNREAKTKVISQNWSDQYAQEDRWVLAESKINKFLSDINGDLTVDENGAVQVIDRETKSVAYDKQNKAVTFDSLVKDIMVNNKYEKVNPTQQSQTGGNANPTFVPIQSGTGAAASISQKEQEIYKSMNDQFAQVR